jgi:hypothetical protein
MTINVALIESKTSRTNWEDRFDYEEKVTTSREQIEVYKGFENVTESEIKKHRPTCYKYLI